MTLVVRPIFRDPARAWIEKHHRTLPPPKNTWLFGAAVYDGERICCVAIVERPPRLLQDGVTACVSRVCSDKTKHAASKCLAAVTRAALALGYRRLVSYSLLGEIGTMYTAAGWRVTAVVKAEKTHGRKGRARDDQPQPGKKIRWEFGPGAKSFSPKADRVRREALQLGIWAA